LEAIAAKPFFLTVSFHAPHAPWSIAEPYYSMYERSRIPLPENRGVCEPADRKTAARRFGDLLGDEGLREYLAVYYGIVSMLDAQIGRLLQALRNTGQDRNTLVILTADHGDMQAGHGMYGKTNFSIYEETTRVPLLLRFPGVIPAGRVIQTQAGSCDLQPTILDYAGLPAPAGIHGRSLRGFIEGREDLDRPIFNERGRGRENIQRTIRTLEWKYAYSSGGGSQLYNLRKDPGETRNLLDDPASVAVKRKLHGDLRRWMKDTEDGGIAAMPEKV
jgi:arylsulfatase A-like enzyme